jgi:hypothetical protein
VAAPLLLTGDAFLSKWGANLPFSVLGIVEGVASSAILALVIGIVLGDLLFVRGESLLRAGGQAPAGERVSVASG